MFLKTRIFSRGLIGLAIITSLLGTHNTWAGGGKDGGIFITDWIDNLKEKLPDDSDNAKVDDKDPNPGPAILEEDPRLTPFFKPPEGIFNFPDSGGTTTAGSSGGTSDGTPSDTSSCGDCTGRGPSFSSGDIYFRLLFLMRTGMNFSGEMQMISPFLGDDIVGNYQVCYNIRRSYITHREEHVVETDVIKNNYISSGSRMLRVFFEGSPVNTEFSAHINMNDSNTVNNHWVCSRFIYGCEGNTYNSDPTTPFYGACYVYDESACNTARGYSPYSGGTTTGSGGYHPYSGGTTAGSSGYSPYSGGTAGGTTGSSGYDPYSH